VLQVVAQDPALRTVDGIAVDVRGNIHAVISGSIILGTAPLVRINPRTGSVTPSTDEIGAFNFPLSLAFGRGPRDRRSVFVTNGALVPDPFSKPPPGVIQVGVGVRGFSGR
jgi:hypothetical protein